MTAPPHREQFAAQIRAAAMQARDLYGTSAAQQMLRAADEELERGRWKR